MAGAARPEGDCGNHSAAWPLLRRLGRAGTGLVLAASTGLLLAALAGLGLPSSVKHLHFVAGRLALQPGPTIPSGACYVFPEARLFNLHPGALLTQQQCPRQRSLAARTLQHALRACMAARGGCAAVQWERGRRWATLCEGRPEELANVRPQHVPCAQLPHSAAITAYRNSTAAAAPSPPPAPHAGKNVSAPTRAPQAQCPEGQMVVGRGDNPCHVCWRGYCRALPGARPVDAFSNWTVLWAEGRRLVGSIAVNYDYSVYNPTLLAYGGRLWVAARVSNWTFCPSSLGYTVFYRWRRLEGYPGFKGTTAEVMLCELDPTLRPRAESCKLLPWTTDARIRKPHPNPYNRASPGFEDPRGFVWGGAPLLSGTVQLVNTRQKNKPWLFVPGFVQLTANLSGVERGMLAQCEGHKGDQKNWMALEYKGALYALSRIHPLEVVRLDWEAGCSVVQRDPGGGEAALQAVLPQGTHLSGGSAFVALGGGRFLSLAHVRGPYPWAFFIYSHHFVLLSAITLPSGEPRFEVEWISEAFRLPLPQSVAAQLDRIEPRGNIQFLTGAALRGGSLLLSYGINDCFCALAEVPGIWSQLERWQELGLGTQAHGPAQCEESGDPGDNVGCVDSRDEEGQGADDYYATYGDKDEET